MSRYFWDSETEGLPDAQLLERMPPDSHWKLGNVKDPDKIKAAILEKQKAWMEDAALEAATGRVLLIGLRINGSNIMLSDNDEAANLKAFWGFVSTGLVNGDSFIGFNTHGFDIPFLVRRSWVHGIQVPSKIMRGRYLNDDLWVDLLEIYRLGNRQDWISLDGLSAMLGVGRKNGEGKNFGSLFRTNKGFALEYAANDLFLVEGCAGKMLPPLPEKQSPGQLHGLPESYYGSSLY